ncbi:MAG: hypothetical protein GX456_14620 [Verrucomicrobia bacterium]|nr:hypothetical protein [Verrucomicrobiota bacterium]
MLNNHNLSSRFDPKQAELQSHSLNIEPGALYYDPFEYSCVGADSY